MNLPNSTAVITGAARGIGRALAVSLLDAGARVVLSDVDESALAATLAEIGNSRARAVPSDVSRADSVAALARAAGDFDIWINNAGLARHRAIPDYSEPEIDAMLAVNLKGTILGSQAALRVMAPRGRGHIVNIVSTASLRGVPTETVYCAAKWGVRGFTQGLREEAAPHGVRVTAVLPGGVDTAFWDAAAPERNLPRAKWLTASQVAEAVISILSMDDAVVPQELVIRAMLDRDFGQ